MSFLNGGSLEPRPPIASKQPGVRYLHVTEDDPIDDAALEEWVRQAAVLPGDELF